MSHTVSSPWSDTLGWTGVYIDSYNNPESLYVSQSVSQEMLSSLSGFAKRLSSYIREPLTALGTAVQNGVYTDEYSVPDYPAVIIRWIIDKIRYFTMRRIQSIRNRLRKCGL